MRGIDGRERLEGAGIRESGREGWRVVIGGDLSLRNMIGMCTRKYARYSRSRLRLKIEVAMIAS